MIDMAVRFCYSTKIAALTDSPVSVVFIEVVIEHRATENTEFFLILCVLRGSVFNQSVAKQPSQHAVEVGLEGSYDRDFLRRDGVYKINTLGM
ncbi:hypothetical protein GCM10028774_10750 [Spirosoma jeollabukense]